MRMRTLRPFPVLGGLAVLAALTLLDSAPALAQDPPSVPAGCGNVSTQGQPISSVSSTDTSITVTWDPDAVGIFGHPGICNTEGASAALGPDVNSGTLTGDDTYTTFGVGDSAPALTADTDYWLSFRGAYGGGTPWVYVRTAAAAASGSVALALNSAGTDSTYHNGDAIEVTATFGENVTVTGTPQIPMTIGSNTRNATYESGSGGTELVFSYTVVTADVDNDGLEIAAGNVALNGGTIKTTVGDTAAALDHGGVSASTAHKVDGAAPGVTSVAISSNAGTDQTYALGDTISVSVTFGKNVTVTGTPRVELSPGIGPPPVPDGPRTPRFASFASGSGTSTLTFRYVVAAGDLQTGGIGVAANGLELNGGTIEHQAGKTALLGHTAVAASADHKVDGVRPTISTIAFTDPPDIGYRTVGDTIKLTATFSESVTVTTGGGTPRIKLNPDFGPGSPRVTRYATYRSGSGGTSLVFAYTLQDGDDSGTTNVSLARDPLQLNGATIKDGAGNTARLTYAFIESSNKTVKAVRPTISAVTVTTGPGVDADLDGHADTFVRNEVISVRVFFDQQIQIDRMGALANIQMVLTIGSTDYALNHSGLSVGNTALSFDPHRVKATDTDSDGITLERQSSTNHVIRLAGGATIKGTSANGANAANLVLAADPNVVWIKSAADTVKSLNVRGTNAAPVSTDFTVTTAVDTDYTFSADDFTFTDGNSDVLKEIRIVSLPASGGTLKLSGTAIPDGDLPKTVSRSDIANLVLDPTAGFNGHATFTFKVVDPFDAVSTDAATATVAVGTPIPTITIAPGTSPVTEGTNADFTVTADFAPSTNLTVNLTVSDASGSDFVAAGDEGAKTVTINSGTTTVGYSVTTQDDSSYEPHGSVTVMVETGTGYNVGAPGSAGVLVNNDDTVAVPAACGTARTENPINSVTTTEADITVVWKSSGFWAPHGSVQLCDSDGTTAFLTAASDPPYGETGTYSKFGTGDSAPALTPGTDYWIRWSGYGSGTAWVYAPTREATGPEVSIAGGSAVTEGTAATFTLTIAEAPTTDVTVNLTVSEKAGSDFVAAANEGATTATIAMGNTKDTVTVATVGDSKDEPNGYVKVTVGSGTGYSVGTPAADSVTVNDDDTNNVATGAPAITGFPQVGQTLTAGTSGIADTDGLTSVSYSYQWIRTDSGTDTDIASATNSTYELTQADSAKTVKVKVTFQDDIGHDETLTSAASGTVQAAAPACDTGNAWCGTLTVAQSTGGSNMRSRGYCNGISARCNTAYGSLDDTDFTLGGTTFVVKSVRWGGPSSSQVRLHLTLDQEFPSTSLSTLKLKVNGHEFALSDAARLPAAVSNNYRWDSNATIRAYEVGREVTVQVIQDPRPTLSLNDAGTDNTYYNGDTIKVTATWPQSVTVVGTPRIPIRIGTATRQANFFGTRTGTAHMFRYVVGSSDTDADGITIAENALTLSGGTIRYSDNTNAEIKHDAVAASTDHKVEGRGASVTAVEFTNLPSTTSYVTIGDSIDVKLTFNRPVTVDVTNGTPRIELAPAFGYNDVTEMNDVVRYAAYRGGSGGKALVFTYEVQDRDKGSNVRVAANKLTLQGGTIRTGTANANLGHTAATSGKGINAQRPRINSVVVSAGPSVDADLNGDADTYVANDTISVIVGFDQAIAVDRMGANANVEIALTIGTSHHELAYAAAHGDTAIRFSARTVATGDADDNGITLQRDASANVVRLSSSATIKGTAANGANPADLTRDADPKVEWIKSSTVTVTSLNVRGTNATPTATNFTVATPTDTDRTFAVGDFTFSDANSDPLKEIEIISLPTSAQGTLVQEGTALANADLPKTVSHADITANKLWFSPTTGFEGDATFTFKVVDSFGAKSTAAATATVKVGASVALSFNAAGDDGTYGLGDIIEITATFAQSVTVTGSPRIPFTIGTTERHANFHGTRTGTAIKFRYTVASNDEDDDGITVAANALENSGGSTIRVGTTTTAAALDHDAVAANTARKVDGVKPTVSSLAVSSTAGSDRWYAIGDAIQLKATFSEAVTVTSSGGGTPTWPQIAFVLGNATKQAVYASGTGTTEIVFSYTVAADDSDTNGIHVNANKLVLNGGAIVDGAGNAATLTHSAIGANTAHRVDGVRPTVNSVRVASGAGTDQTYAIGDTIALTVRFTENVTVASSGGATPTRPRIALTVGTTEKYAGYRRGSGTRDIRFHYVVEAGDADADGISVAANKLELNGGTIVDNVGNAATLTHTALANQANHKVDGVAPTVSSIAVTSDAGTDQTYAIGDHIELTATFSENVTVTSGSSNTDQPYIPVVVGTTARRAYYNRGSGSTQIVFRYTVTEHATNVDTDGITVTANTLTKNDTGALKDGVGNAATLTHTALAAQSSHKVDGVRPTVSAPPASSARKCGSCSARR